MSRQVTRKYPFYWPINLNYIYTDSDEKSTAYVVS